MHFFFTQNFFILFYLSFIYINILLFYSETEFIVVLVVLRILLGFFDLADDFEVVSLFCLLILSSISQNRSLLFLFDQIYDLNIAVPKIKIKITVIINLKKI